MTGAAPKETLLTAHGRLAYRRSGTRGAPRLLLLHGLPTSSHLWRHALPALGARFDTVALDLLGFGDSDQPAGASYRLASHAERLREFLDELHWDRCTLVGHDVGGGVAALVAARHPDAVERLVLVDTIAYENFPIPAVQRLRDPALGARVEARGLEAGFRRAFQRGMVHRTLPAEDLAEYVRPFAGPAGGRAYLRAARELDTNDWMRERSRIETFPRPCLVLWGARDAFLPPASGRRLADALPEGRFELVPDAGHYLPEDRPEELVRHLLAFATG